MDKLSYRCHRFSSIVIQQAVWLYFRFALSYRDVEDLLAERGIDVAHGRDEYFARLLPGLGDLWSTGIPKKLVTPPSIAHRVLFWFALR